MKTCLRACLIGHSQTHVNLILFSHLVTKTEENSFRQKILSLQRFIDGIRTDLRTSLLLLLFLATSHCIVVIIMDTQPTSEKQQEKGPFVVPQSVKQKRPKSDEDLALISAKINKRVQCTRKRIDNPSKQFH